MSDLKEKIRQQFEGSFNAPEPVAEKEVVVGRPPTQQEMIVRQNALTQANFFNQWNKDDKTMEKILRDAEVFEKWVLRYVRC